MSTTDSRPDHDSNPLLGLGSSAGLGAWQPIETAPRDGSHFLLSDGQRVSLGGWVTDVYHGADWEGQLGMAGWWAVDLGANGDRPTHWMPLPAPPQGVSDAPNVEVEAPLTALRKVKNGTD